MLALSRDFGFPWWPRNNWRYQTPGRNPEATHPWSLSEVACMLGRVFSKLCIGLCALNIQSASFSAGRGTSVTRSNSFPVSIAVAPDSVKARGMAVAPSSSGS